MRSLFIITSVALFVSVMYVIGVIVHQAASHLACENSRFSSLFAVWDVKRLFSQATSHWES